MKAFVIALMAACVVACGVGPVPGEEQAGGDCGPTGDLLRASSSLHGDFSSGDTQYWSPEGACSSWGDGVQLVSTATLAGGGEATVTKAGCRLTSTLVPVPAWPRGALRQSFRIQVRSMREDDACVMGSASASHCAEVVMRWYDLNGRFMFEELFQVGGPRPREWHTSDTSGFASDYAGYYSLSVSGPMYGIDVSPTHIDYVSVAFGE